MRVRSCPLFALFWLLLASCQSSLDYGYYVEAFGDDAIRALIEESDRSIMEKDMITYKSLLGPGFTLVDNTADASFQLSSLSRSEYVQNVAEIFYSSSRLEIYTTITDIEYIEPGALALVTVQEDFREYSSKGRLQMRVVSIAEHEIANEEGWIYFKKSTTQAKQAVKE